jgi:hypothetical protein
MFFAIELFFDDETSGAIRRAWRVLKEVSGSDYMMENGVYPHVALAVFEADDVARAEKVLGQCGRMISFCLKPTGLDSFSGEIAVVFLGFAPDAPLLSVHQAVAGSLNQAGLVVNPYYQREVWRPHCTLAMQFPASLTQKVITAATNLSWECPYRVESMALVSFPPTRLVRKVISGTPA